jgi:hypothetical protein
MTRKDYEAIASILRNRREAVEVDISNPFATALSTAHLDLIESDLIELFESENPRFDRYRFLSASRATRSRREAVLSQLEEAKR